MNRRDLLKRAFAISAAGLLVPERRVWALDRTMIPASPAVRKTLFNPDGSIFETGWFDASMPLFNKVIVLDGMEFPLVGMLRPLTVEWGNCAKPLRPD